MGSHHYADDPRMGRFLEGRHVARVVNIGSAEKFCRVAEGSADLYPRFGRTMEWDTAAPQAVVEAAGGRVLLLEGRAPLLYAKLGFENPGFVCEGLPG
jgi:3'(2'), 5'-bisphosphate nucleotidase